MPEYEKVVEGLKHCKQGAKGCTNCPYGDPYNACQWLLMEDALELLEYQQIHLDAFIKDQKNVQCKDCWKRDHDNCPFHEHLDFQPEDHFYCAYGERKEK